MQKSTDYSVKKIDAQTLKEELSCVSPLKMSQTLLHYELYDQTTSLEVLESIYQDFEDKRDIIDELVTPVFLNIADALVRHPKLGLAKTGITASRLINEIKGFSYDESHSSKRDIMLDKANLDKNTNSTVDKKGGFNRSELDNNRRSSIAKERFNGNRTAKSDLEVRDNGASKRLYLYQNDEAIQARKEKGHKTTHLTQNADHNLPLKKVFEDFGKSKVLSTNDLKNIANIDKNFDIISENLNKSKGDSTWSEYLEKKPDAVNEATKKKILAREKEAVKELEKEGNKKVINNLMDDKKHIQNIAGEAGKQAMNDSKHKAIGEVIILIIKPLYYEFSDIFKNGILYGFDINDKIEAFIERVKRVKNYVLDNAIGTLFDNFKDFLQNFVTMIVNGIVNAFVGLIKKVLQVISEGFMAIVEAIKIMLKPAHEMSPAQKADAITKLLATTVITFLGAYFEETILSFMNGTPFEFLKDIIMIMLTGIASTVVVWLIDQADLFSVKAEKRIMRVKEVFEMRVQSIKENTDIFETASLEILAKQRIQFTDIITRFSTAIDSNQSVNNNVMHLASFMQIDLKVQTTNEFIELLKSNKQIVI